MEPVTGGPCVASDENAPVLADGSTVTRSTKESSTPALPMSVASAVPPKTSMLPGAICAMAGEVAAEAAARSAARAARETELLCIAEATSGSAMRHVLTQRRDQHREP